MGMYLGYVRVDLKGLELVCAHARVKILREEGGKCNAQFILAILPENAEELRNAVKRFGDIEQGVATQCVVRSSFYLI